MYLTSSGEWARQKPDHQFATGVHVMSVDYMRGELFVRTIGAEAEDDYCEDCLGYLQRQQELEGHYDKSDGGPGLFVRGVDEGER